MRRCSASGGRRICLRNGLLWLVDLEQNDRRMRVDLSKHLTGVRSSLPGVALEDVTLDRLAEKVAELAMSTTQPMLGQPGGPDVGDGLMNWIMHELWALGFNDVTTSSLLGDTGLVSDVLHIAVWQKRGAVSVGAIQRHVGVAAVERKVLLMVSLTGFSREATAFANQASAFLFEASPIDGRISPRSKRAVAVSMPQIGP